MDVDESQPSRGTLRGLSERPGALATGYLLLAVVLAALGWNGLWSVFSLLPERVSPWWTLAAAAPACALVLLRKRAPGPALFAAAAIFVADLVTVGGLVPLLVLLDLFDAHIMRLDAERRRRLLGVIVLSGLLPLLVALAFSGDLRASTMVGIQFGALVGMTYWYANFKAQSRELVELYRQRAEDTARLAELDRAVAVRGERERMARDLHDVVAGHVSAVAIRSEAALGMPDGPGRAEAERRSLRAVRDASLEAHEALRSMIQVLRTGEQSTRASPGRAQIAELVEAAKASGLGEATLVDEIDWELPAPVDRAVGRIAQESLANAVRHASGGDVAVRLSEHDGEVRIEVVSRGGSALPRLRGSGMGLASLVERARAIGGELSAGPDADGWAVRARLPRDPA